MSELAINGGKPAVDYELPSIKNYSGRTFGLEEAKGVLEVLESGTLGYLNGPKIREFQNKWAVDHGVETAVCVSSGTAALHTAINFLDLGAGDEVLVPAISDMGTVLGVMLQGATPVFVDVDPVTQNIDVSDIENHLTDRTRAILPVHLFGYPCEIDTVVEIARRHNLYVVEDCCQAHASTYKGRLVGTFGDAACYSFQQSKHITTGDGGMVMAKKDYLCGRKLIHCHDKAWPREVYRDHLFLAPNYHFTDLQAAVGLVQYSHLNEFVAQRRKSALYLSELLRDITGAIPPGDSEDATHTFFEYNLVLDMEQFKVDNKVLAQAITAEGVHCSPSYLPQPLYMYDVVAKRYDVRFDQCPNAVKACASMLYIPWTEKTTCRHAEDISTAIHKVLSYYHR